MTFKKVTFTQLITTIAIAMLFVSILILYEAKTSFFQHITESNSRPLVVTVANRLELTPNSVDIVQTFLKGHSEVDVVGVVDVDLTQNTRTNMLRMFNDKALEHIITEQNSKAPEKASPLFTSDTVNNAEISSLLSGEFACTGAPDSPFVKAYGLQEVIKTTCRVPVPPYYGRLTGYLALYSKQELSIYEKDQLRAAAIRLAVDMYYQGGAHSMVSVANPS